MKKTPSNIKKGFSIVEVVLATTIFSLLVTAVVGAIIFGRESTATAGQRARASYLADEAIEATRAISDESFANLVDGSHGLAISGGKWVFSGTGDLVGIFNRQLEIKSIDLNTKEITATINWQATPTRAGQVIATSRLTNWLAAVLPPIGDWSAPRQSASLDLVGSQNRLKLQVQGNFVYVVSDRAGNNLDVIDVSNPDGPISAATLAVAGKRLNNIVVSGNYAYISTDKDDNELQIVDISNPSAPFVVGGFDAAGNADAKGIDYNNNKIYLVRDSSSDQELVIIDVTTPSSPTLLGALELGAAGNEIKILGSYAYISSADDSQELQVIDISTPSSPNKVGTLNLAGAEDGMAIAGFGNTIVLGRDNVGLFLIDVTTPSVPALSGSINVGTVNDISLGNSNKYVFIAASNATTEFQVIDITAPATPKTVGTLDMTDPNFGISYDMPRDRAYLASGADNQDFIVIAPQ